MARQIWSELANWVMTDGSAVANTTNETIIFPNYTVIADYMQTDRCLRVEAFGRFSTTATPTLRLRARMGGLSGVLIWDSGTITTTTVTAALWWLKILIQTRTGGASGTVFAMGLAALGSAAAPTVASATGAPAIGIFGVAGDDTPAASAAIDLTADQGLALTAQWSAASASNTLTGHMRTIETMN